MDIRLYSDQQKLAIIDFYRRCLQESGRELDLNGKHKVFQDINHYYDKFWCLYEEEKLIGTVAIRKMDERKCELKSLYLYGCYQGQGLGYKLLSTAVEYAKKHDFDEMYLDTISTSTRAIHLYEKAGFQRIDRYNENQNADVFMVKDLAR